MATQRVTPGARLLRSSRLFALPKPLPAVESASTVYATPSTATTPYPTSQAIFTPYSSRVRGDWGLKRPLPLKTTLNTTTPSIRVKAIDAVEKLTDFNSSSDLTLTLAKFQELGLALTMPIPSINRSFAGKVSVFEESHDFTAITEREGDVSHQRWKFKGPWLGGMTAGQFDKYLASLRPRRSEFREFLRGKLAVEISQAESRKAIENGEGNTPVAKTSADITDDQVNNYIHRLRDDSERFTLFSYVSEFLDLAPITPPNQGNSEAIKPVNPYATEGPPKCHPSAGLSYLRTSQYLTNHPLYGPQRHRLTRARILSPWKGVEVPKLGVAGIVADIPLGQNPFNLKNPNRVEAEMARIPGIMSFNHEIPGGAKVHVNPKMARIDSQGRVQLTVDEGTPESRLVFDELQGKANIYRKVAKPVQETQETDAATPLPMPTRRARLESQYQQHRRADVVGSVQNYGLGQ
ncbi:hypothetical protein TD95_001136 [Thielaviopsis punctulata]|uniref:Uncharacterized protein n=1 Tax=Thielaviopsis punctulata TaxID=72032 RepID=A0A0F4ZAA0_9PEZI|nr:hypothetical protein TD95_001136 [Thielaviopsis punctulata]